MIAAPLPRHAVSQTRQARLSLRERRHDYSGKHRSEAAGEVEIARRERTDQAEARENSAKPERPRYGVREAEEPQEGAGSHGAR
jgi:hypothetical protein